MELGIETQLSREGLMLQRGIAAFERSLQSAEQSDRGSKTSYGRKLLDDCIRPVIDGIADIQIRKPGKAGRAQLLLADIDAEVAAFLAMQVLLNSFTYEASTTSTAVKIGQRIEDDIRFSRFKKMHDGYYQSIVHDFARRKTHNYRHKHIVLTKCANEWHDDWEEWTTGDRADVGMRLIDVVLSRTNLLEKRTVFENGKTYVHLVPTPEALRQVAEHNDFAKLLFPDRMPCVIQPDDWTGIDQGGFYSAELRRVTPMVKTSSKRHRKVVEQADLSKTMAALNTVQQVPWSLNSAVYTILCAAWDRNLPIGMPNREPLQVPPSPFVGRDKDTLTEDELARLTDWKHEAAEIYTRERERISKAFLAARVIRMAEEYLDYSRFWYVWYADFRGRLYTATSGFSPQGPDMAKGILRFAEGKPLGADGWFWLQVHGANRYGYDKVSYEDRVAWVDQNRDVFIAAANDPMLLISAEN